MSNIRMVAFYQGVKVDTRTEKSYSPDSNQVDKAQHKGWTATVESNGVMLRTKLSDILVPFNNVAYIIYEKSEPVKVSELAKPSKAK
jgi:hypothetical protein